MPSYSAWKGDLACWRKKGTSPLPSQPLRLNKTPCYHYHHSALPTSPKNNPSPLSQWLFYPLLQVETDSLPWFAWMKLWNAERMIIDENGLLYTICISLKICFQVSATENWILNAIFVYSEGDHLFFAESSKSSAEMYFFQPNRNAEFH